MIFAESKLEIYLLIGMSSVERGRELSIDQEKSLSLFFAPFSVGHE